MLSILLATQLDHWKFRTNNILVRGSDHAKPIDWGYWNIEVRGNSALQLQMTTDGLSGR